MGYVAGKKAGRYSTYHSAQSREKRVHSQPDTTLFQGSLASSHARRAKSDQVSVWVREKERERGKGNDREKQRKRVWETKTIDQKSERIALKVKYLSQD